jgi:hypothetical protein
MKILAKHHPGDRFIFIMVGSLCTLVGIFSSFGLVIGTSWFSVLLGCFFLLGGSAFVWAGFNYWPGNLVALGYDESGLYWAPIGYRCNPKPLFIPWDDIAGVSLQSFPDSDYSFLTRPGLILGLSNHAPWPEPERAFRYSAIALRKKFDRLAWRKVLPLYHHDWEWNPIEVLRLIQSKILSKE